jgi:hypothetical protein
MNPAPTENKKEALQSEHIFENCYKPRPCEKQEKGHIQCRVPEVFTKIVDRLAACFPVHK